ncbi:DUF397 domain-containing protein [Streptomyces sp. UNOC14_S4]|uniref:DUF397 domain-containing protein n=1 Tax=Streptomyces sp. UNOC14_S4 TaxID=2872340 RepID=UPI001E4B1741|nr:DUF397 domain-containing protein [Streptomyces sp. UNOC14_S4]MCC3770792.1 DUF397 domain-containing protein [Streptomyces sp. UNOC14_S4]
MRTNSETAWRKSSYSNGGDGSGGGSCVEAVTGIASAIPIRDSKTPTGPALSIQVPAWADFVTGIIA